MKKTYKYEFVTGAVEVEISEEWAAVLYELDRREYNNNHTETRRHISLDTVKNNNKSVISPEPDVADLIVLKEELQMVEMAIGSLPLGQQEVIDAVCYEGMLPSDFAVSKGISRAAATDRLMRARKNLKNFCKRP